MGQKGISHLHDRLIDQVDRLTAGDLSPEELDREIRRSEALTKLAATTIVNARLAFDAEKHAADTGRSVSALVPLLSAPSERS